MIKLIKPNALQIFGCGSESKQEKYLKIASKLMTDKKNRILITAASKPTKARSIFRYPKLVFRSSIIDKKPWPTKQWFETLKHGEYSLSSGINLAVLEMKVTSYTNKTTTSDHSSQSSPKLKLSVKVQAEPEPGIRINELVFYSGNKIIASHKFSRKKNETPHIVFKKIDIDYTAKLIRVAAKGYYKHQKKSILQNKKQQISLLGTTNFIPITDMANY